VRWSLGATLNTLVLSATLAAEIITGSADAMAQGVQIDQ